MKKNDKKYEILWTAYHTAIVILLAGLLIVEVLEYLRYPAHFFGV
tara:strand:- start:359 stop:493 length:135 start_codon:yes stop_codon:yes gene_type:complete